MGQVILNDLDLYTESFLYSVCNQSKNVQVMSLNYSPGNHWYVARFQNPDSVLDSAYAELSQSNSTQLGQPNWVESIFRVFFSSSL